jgi:hypothetical protein
MNKLPFTAFALMGLMFLASCGGEDNKTSTDDKTNKEENKDKGVTNNAQDTDAELEDVMDVMEDVEGAMEGAMEDVMDVMEDVEGAMEDVMDVMEDVVVADRSNNSECDEYLAGYEKFMDNYITILKKQQADPSDMSIMEEYMSIMTEGTEWASKTPDCTDMEFLGKLMEIQMKMANAASGMY